MKVKINIGTEDARRLELARPPVEGDVVDVDAKRADLMARNGWATYAGRPPADEPDDDGESDADAAAAAKGALAAKGAPAPKK